MNSFPDKLNVKNRNLFSKIYRKRIKAYLRKDLYEHILSKEEKDFFDLNPFIEKMNDKTIFKKLLDEVRDELSILGWKTQTSFGETGLFIYEKNPPPNCYPDGF